MRAILFQVGERPAPHTRIYVLADEAKCEVAGFLFGNSGDSAVPGFLAVLGRIEMLGTADLPGEVLKQFKTTKKGERVWQIRKGNWRLLGFKYSQPQRLLLVTCFRKRNDVADHQYARALKLKQRFDSDPKWGDK